MKDLSLTSLTLLTIVFITLKLTSVITWSWWWVLSPMIAELAIFLITAYSVMRFISIKRKADKLKKQVEEMRKNNY